MLNTHYPSLFLLLNVHEAHWYRVHEDRVEEIVQYEDKKDTYLDREGFFGNTGKGVVGRVGEPDVMNARREEERHHNLREIAEKTALIWKEGGFVHLTCAVPEQHKGLMHDELERALPSVKIKWLYGNYTGANEPKVLAFFKESLKVFHE